MATSGSHIVKWALGGVNQVKFSWERTSFSTVENTSTINWKLELIVGTGGGFVSVNDRAWRVIINGLAFVGRYAPGNIIGGQTFEIASGTAYIPHNADGTKTFAYSFYTELDFFSSEKAVEGSGTGALDPILLQATILSAPNFNDEENPTITYNNPAGENATSLQACISFTGAADDVTYRDISKTDSTYTFELTPAERRVLRAGTAENSRTLRFYIRSIVNDITYWSFLDKTFTIVNGAPTFSPTVRDVNERTAMLTGDDRVLISGYSKAYFTTGLAAKKESTIVDTTIINGAQTMRLDGPIYNGTLDKVTSNTYYFSATDSRGNITKDFITTSLIPYVPLTCYLTIDRFTANGVLTFTIAGQYFNDTFGDVLNSMELEYALRENDGDIQWTRLGFINPTMVETSRYSYTYTITGLNYLSNYELTVNVIDELTPVQSVSKVIAATPIFDWSKEDFNFNIPVNAQKGIVVPNDYNGMTPNDVGGGVYYVNGNGEYTDLISVRNDTISIGAENAINGVGSVYIGGSTVNLGGDVRVNNCEIAKNKVLWSGVLHMGSEHNAWLNEAISDQAHGIILVFSYFSLADNEAKSHSWTTHFVPKEAVNFNEGGGHTFLMGINAGFSSIGAKYLFIYNTRITGHSGNTSTGANSGITFKNTDYALRYVIGV